MSTSSDGPADPADPTGPAGEAPDDTTPLPPTQLPPPPLASSSTMPSLEPASAPSLPTSTEPPLQPSLTPPPDAALAGAAPSSSVPIGARNGDLTPRWRYVLAAAWVIAFFAYAAIWQASVQIGIGTWWVGPRAQPTHTIVRVLPSLLTISIAMCAIYSVPRLVRLSATGVLLATIIAIPDLSRSIGLGVAELVIAGLLGLVTIAARSGRYRLAPDPSAHDLGSVPTSSEAAGDDGGDTAHVPHNGARGGAPDRANDDTQRRTDDDAAMASFAPPDQTGH